MRAVRRRTGCRLVDELTRRQGDELTRGKGHREKKEIPYGLVHYPAVPNSIEKDNVSDACMAREQHKHGSRATLAILTGVAGNTRGLCLPNPWALQAKPDGIACKTR